MFTVLPSDPMSDIDHPRLLNASTLHTLLPHQHQGWGSSVMRSVLYQDCITSRPLASRGQARRASGSAVGESVGIDCGFGGAGDFVGEGVAYGQVVLEWPYADRIPTDPEVVSDVILDEPDIVAGHYDRPLLPVSTTLTSPEASVSAGIRAAQYWRAVATESSNRPVIHSITPESESRW